MRLENILVNSETTMDHMSKESLILVSIQGTPNEIRGFLLAATIP